MAFRYLGPDKIDIQIESVLEALAEGKAPREIEVKSVDIKEEPNRRDKDGNITPGERTSEKAAVFLAHELSCMANTPGAGAIILGVSDDGQHIGTELDPEWLRHRIYEVSNRLLTVNVQAGELNGVRLLIIRAPEAIEPVRSKGKIYWRVAANCVEVDAASWSEGRLHRAGFDWSAQASGHVLADARASALEAARDFLVQAGDESSTNLASASDFDLLRRLNLVSEMGYLSNAGSLLFVSTPSVGIDYIRRDHQGGDSILRIQKSGPLLLQLAEVEQAAMASNPTIHLPAGFARGQVRNLPPGAVREAIVNGVVHRDWQVPTPTVIEHVGNSLTVTSPGGFVSGVSTSNIITHPSAPRYRALASAVSSLRLSEREGIGIDRMVADMIALGYSQPEFQEIDGPYIRVALVGGTPNEHWMSFLGRTNPETTQRDVDALLLLDLLIRKGWFDVETAAPVLQRSRPETEAAIQKLSQAKVEGDVLIMPVAGTPVSDPPAWRLSGPSRSALESRVAHHQDSSGRQRLISDWAQVRNRVSSAEAADLTGLTQNYAGTLLQGMEEDGLLVPSRSNRRGRGFYYLPSTEP